jgi:hypothetical protein
VAAIDQHSLIRLRRTASSIYESDVNDGEL